MIRGVLADSGHEFVRAVTTDGVATEENGTNEDRNESSLVVVAIRVVADDGNPVEREEANAETHLYVYGCSPVSIVNSSTG